jgi:hypothetical protein
MFKPAPSAEGRVLRQALIAWCRCAPRRIGIQAIDATSGSNPLDRSSRPRSHWDGSEKDRRTCIFVRRNIFVAVRYEQLAHIAALLGRFLPRLGAVQSF